MPTVRFQVLYVFLVLAHDRRRILHFGVTAHPTAEWTAQQLREAFPWDSAPRYLLRDRGSAPTARSMDLCATPHFAQSSQVLSIVGSIDMLPPSSRNCVFFCRHSLCGAATLSGDRSQSHSGARLTRLAGPVKIPSLRIFVMRVVRLSPSFAAAPSDPPTTQLV